ncbi:MAG: barstar family protein [Sandaracinaceae bacterium]|nr:barstar family protein [Sandaracinaceae bacterium]
MNRADSFDFTDTPSLGADAFIVRIPPGLSSAETLLQALYDQAGLPGYFGFNWQALSDCLRDLHWVDCRQVVLLHTDLPALPLQDLMSYLDVLAECVASWVPGEEHSLTVIFPSAARLQVAGALLPR